MEPPQHVQAMSIKQNLDYTTVEAEMNDSLAVCIGELSAEWSLGRFLPRAG